MMDTIDRISAQIKAVRSNFVWHLSLVSIVCMLLALPMQTAYAEGGDLPLDEEILPVVTIEDEYLIDEGVPNPGFSWSAESVFDPKFPGDEVLDSDPQTSTSESPPSGEPPEICDSQDISNLAVPPEECQSLEEFSEDEDDSTPSDETASSDSCLVSEATDPSESVLPSESPSLSEQCQVSEEFPIIEDSSTTFDETASGDTETESEVPATAETSSSSENEMDSETTEDSSDLNPQDAETNDGSDLIEETTSDGSAEESEAPATSDPSSSFENETGSEVTESSSDADPLNAEVKDGSDLTEETVSDSSVAESEAPATSDSSSSSENEVNSELTEASSDTNSQDSGVNDSSDLAEVTTSDGSAAESEEPAISEVSSSSENELDLGSTEASSDPNPQDTEANDGSDLIEEMTSDSSAGKSEEPATSDPSLSSENELDLGSTEASSDPNPQDPEVNDGSDLAEETGSNSSDLDASKPDLADPQFRPEGSSPGDSSRGVTCQPASPVTEELLTDNNELTVNEEIATEPATTDILSVPDPYYYVSGEKHRYLPIVGDCSGDPNCWVSDTPIQAAINAVNGLTIDDDTLYIEGSLTAYDEGTSSDLITISGFNSRLILNGGVDLNKNTDGSDSIMDVNFMVSGSSGGIVFDNLFFNTGNTFTVFDSIVEIINSTVDAEIIVESSASNSSSLRLSGNDSTADQISINMTGDGTNNVQVNAGNNPKPTHLSGSPTSTDTLTTLGTSGDDSYSLTPSTLTLSGTPLSTFSELEDITITNGETLVVIPDSGDYLDWNMDLFFPGGDVTVSAPTVIINDDVTISTRQISGSDHLNDPSTGDSGIIAITGNTISIGENAKLLSHVEDNSNYSAGEISLIALDTEMRMFQYSPVEITNKSATITLDGATIRGGDVIIMAEAGDINPLDELPDYVNAFVGDIVNLVNQVSSIGISSFFGVDATVMIRGADATVNLLDATFIESSGDITIEAKSVANASLQAIAVGSGGLNPLPTCIAVGYGQAEASSTTTIGGSTQIIAAKNVTITSDASTNATVIARTTANLGKLNPLGAEEVDPNSLSVALAIASTELDSTINVEQNVQVVSNFGNVNIKAEGTATTVPLALPSVYGDGSVGIGVALGFDNSNVDAVVEGSLIAKGSAINIFDPQGTNVVDLSNDTIRIENHDLKTGQQVIYNNGGGTDLGGLNDGTTYTVLVIDDDHIQLTRTASIDLDNRDVNNGATHTFNAFDNMDFTPATAGIIDGNNHILNISNHGFTDGQLIVYFPSIYDPIQGLESGKQYEVELDGVTDTVNEFKLRNQLNDQLVEFEDNSPDGVHSFIFESPAIAFNASTSIDNEKDTITFSVPHGLATSEAIIYRTDPTISGTLTQPVFNADGSQATDADGNLLFQTVTASDTSIRGLVDSGVYNVVVVTPFTVRLTTSEPDALAAQAIDFTTTGTGNAHKLNPGSTEGVGIYATLEVLNRTVSSPDIGGSPSWKDALVQAAIAPSLPSLLPWKGYDFAKENELAEQDKSKFSLASGVSITYFVHNVTVRVGSSANIESLLDVLVKAYTDQEVALYAKAGVSKPKGTTEGVVVAAAVGVGLYNNNVSAIVDQNAEIDAVRAIRVNALLSYPLRNQPLDLLNPVEYFKEGVWGLLFFLDGKLGFTSKLFNTAVFTNGSTGGDLSIAGSVAVSDFNNNVEAIIRDGAQINQTNTPEFRAGNQTVEVNARTEMEIVEMAGIMSIDLTYWLSNPGKLLSDFKKNNVGAQAIFSKFLNPVGNSSDKGGLGGSFLLTFINNSTTAKIGAASMHTSETGGLTVNSTEDIMCLSFAQSGGSAGTFGLSGSVVFVDQDSTTHAIIASGVTITGGPVDVNATDTMTHISIAGTWQKGKNIAIGVSIAINLIDRDTMAVIGSVTETAGSDGTSIDVNGDITINASSIGNLFAVSLSGAKLGKDSAGNPVEPEEKESGIGAIIDSADLTKNATDILDGQDARSNDQGNQGKFGIGISGDVSINIVTDKVRALINDAGDFVADHISLTANSLTSIFSLAGAVMIQTGTQAPGIGLAGSYSQTQLKDNLTQASIIGATITVTDRISLVAAREGDISTITAGVNGSFSKKNVSIAGSVSNNDIFNTTEVSLENLDLMANGDVTLSAVDNSEIHSIAGAATLGGKVGFGAAVALNTIENDTRATINNANVWYSGQLELSAINDNDIQSITAALALTTGQAGIAGTVSINEIANIAKASITNSQVPADETGQVGTLSMLAKDTSRIWAFSGALGVAKTAGVGAGVAYNRVGNQVLALIDGSTLRIADSLYIVAQLDTSIKTLAIGAGGGKNLGLAGAVAVNLINNTALSAIQNNSNIDAGGMVSLTAEDRSSIDADAGGFAIALALGSKGGVSLGISVAINEISNTVKALIDTSSIFVGPDTGAPGTLNFLFLTAVSNSEIEVLSIAGAVVFETGQGSGLAFAGAGAISLNTVSNLIETRIDGGDVKAGLIFLGAGDESSIHLNAAGGAITVAIKKNNTGALSVGVAYAVNDIGNTIRTIILDSKVTADPEGITLLTTSTAKIDALAVGAAVTVTVSGESSASLSGSGAVVENRIHSTLESLLRNNQPTPGRDMGVRAAGRIKLEVSDDSSIKSKAGAGSLAVDVSGNNGISIAVGIALAENDIGNSIISAIESSAVESFGGDILIKAISTSNIESLSVAVSAAVTVSSNVGVSLAGGISEATNTIHNQVEALVLDCQPNSGNQVAAHGDVDLVAEDESIISSKAYAVAVSLTISPTGLSASLAYNQATNDIQNTVHSGIMNSKVQSNIESVMINASSMSSIWADAYTVSVAASFSFDFGAAFSVGYSKATNIVNNTVLVDVINQSAISAYQDVILSAQDDSGLDVGIYTVSVSIGMVSFGVAAVESENSLISTISIFIKDSSLTTTIGDIALEAVSSANSKADTLVVSASLTAAGAGTKTTSNVSPTVEVILADNTQVVAGGDLSLDAQVTGSSQAMGTGVSAALGYSASGAVIDSRLNPTLKALTQEDVTISAGNIYLTTRLNVDEVGLPINATYDGESVGPAYGDVILGSGALVAGVAGGRIDVANSPTLETAVGAGTIINTDGDVALRSLSYQLAESNGLSVGAGLGVGVGTVLTFAEAVGTVDTHFDSQLAGGNSLTLESDVDANTMAYGRAVGVALLGAYAGPTVEAMTAPQVNTYIASDGDVTATNDITVASIVYTNADADGRAFSVAILGAVGITNIQANSKPAINTYIESGVPGLIQIQSESGSIRITSLHNYATEGEPKPINDKGAWAYSSIDTYAGICAVGITTMDANASAGVVSRVDSGVLLTAPNGTVAIETRSSNLADARVISNTGATVSISYVDMKAYAFGITKAEQSGDIYNPVGVEKHTGAVDVIVLAEAYDTATSIIDQRIGGVVTISTMNNLAASTPFVRTTVGSGIVVKALNDISVSAISNTDADAFISAGSVGVVNVSHFSPLVYVHPQVNVTLRNGVVLEAGENVEVVSSHETCDIHGGSNPESLAAVGSSSGGFINIGDTIVKTIIYPFVKTYLNEGVSISGGDVSITSFSRSSARASTSGAGSGFFNFSFAEASVNADGSYPTVIEVFIYPNSSIQAENNVLINALSENIFDADGTHFSFGYMEAAASVAEVNLNYRIRISIDGGAQINAGNQLSIFSQSIQDLDTHTFVLTSDDSLSSSRIFIGDYQADSSIRVGDNSQGISHLEAKNIDIQAVSDISAYAGATSGCIDTGFLSDGGTYAEARIHTDSDPIMQSNIGISLDNAELHGEAVSLIAKSIFAPETYTDSWCFVPFGGCNYEDAIEIAEYNLDTSVKASSSSSVTAHELEVRSEFTKQGSAIISTEYARSLIEWDADVHLLAKPELTLVVNTDGVVEQADGINVDGGKGAGYSVGPQFSVDDISNYHPGNIAFWVSWYTLDAAGSPKSTIRNSLPSNQPTITFEHQSPKITITNNSSSEMLIHGIQNVDFPKPGGIEGPKVVHTPLGFLVVNLVDMSEFGFYVSYAPVQTEVHLSNTHPDGPDILLGPHIAPPPGVDTQVGINNPIGFTHIQNDFGNILSQGGVQRTDGFYLQAPHGDIGDSEATRVGIEVVVSDDGPSDPALRLRAAEAGGDLYLALRGLLRTTNATIPMVVAVDHLNAGGVVDLELQEGISQLTHPVVLHYVWVGAHYFIFGPIGENVCVHYPTAGFPCSSVDILGLYGEGNLPIETILNFRPRLLNLTVTSPINENDNVVLWGEVSDPDPLDTFTLSVDWGDGLTDSINLPAGTTTFELTHRYLDDHPSGTPGDDYPISVILTDNNGGSDQKTLNATVINIPPRLAGISIQSPIEENEVAFLSGNIIDPGTLDSFTLNVDWGDGMNETVNLAAGTTSFALPHSYLDDQPGGTPVDEYLISISVTDDDLGSDTADIPVMVQNAAPVVTGLILSESEINEWSVVTLNGNFSDAGILDTHTVTIDWGDGNTSNLIVNPGTHIFFDTHFYADDAPSGTPSDDTSIVVTVTDDDLGSGSSSTSLIVHNLAPEITALNLSEAEINEGETVSLNGSFTDVGVMDTHRVVVDWGDGTLSDTIVDAAAQTFSADHQYLDDPIGTASDEFQVAVIVIDDDEGSGSSELPLLVRNLDPTITEVSITSSINENEVAVLRGKIYDPGLNDSFTLTVAWGDGATTIEHLATGATAFELPHRYLDDHPSGTSSDDYILTISLVDDDGGLAMTTRQVTVNNVAPVVSIDHILDECGLQIWNEGRIVLMLTEVELIASFWDSGTLDRHNATLDWGDGIVESFVDPSALFLARHIYSIPGQYTIVLEVVDDDTGVGLANALIEVLDPLGAISHAIEMLLIYGDQSDEINSALDKLRGNNEGRAGNGALQMLEKGNLNAALEKIKQALQNMEEAEAADPDLDLTQAKALLALSAKSITLSKIAQVESLATKPKELEKIAQAKEIMIEGDELLVLHDFLGAVELYQAAQREVQGIS